MLAGAQLTAHRARHRAAGSRWSRVNMSSSQHVAEKGKYLMHCTACCQAVRATASVRRRRECCCCCCCWHLHASTQELSSRSCRRLRHCSTRRSDSTSCFTADAAATHASCSSNAAAARASCCLFSLDACASLSCSTSSALLVCASLVVGDPPHTPGRGEGAY